VNTCASGIQRERTEPDAGSLLRKSAAVSVGLVGAGAAFDESGHSEGWGGGFPMSRNIARKVFSLACIGLEAESYRGKIVCREMKSLFLEGKCLVIQRDLSAW